MTRPPSTVTERTPYPFSPTRISAPGHPSPGSVAWARPTPDRSPGRSRSHRRRSHARHVLLWWRAFPGTAPTHRRSSPPGLHVATNLVVNYGTTPDAQGNARPSVAARVCRLPCGRRSTVDIRAPPKDRPGVPMHALSMTFRLYSSGVCQTPLITFPHGCATDTQPWCIDLLLALRPRRSARTSSPCDTKTPAPA